jgi:very-short-patch-repair endonuclease
MTSDRLPILPVLEESGSVLRREALEFGLTRDEVERLLKQGVFVRVRRGAYALGDRWARLTPEQRHLVTARAVLRALPRPAVLGHVTAAVAHGLPVWGADLSHVHVLRRSRRLSAHVEAGVVHHAAQLPDEHLTTVEGVPVTTVARTVIDHARGVPFDAGVVTADAALNRELVAQEDLRELLHWQSDWPGSRGAGRVVVFADGRSESVGESRGRVHIAAAGLPKPELQVEIRDEWGNFVGRADFLFDHLRTIAEFDGRVKYRVENAGARLEDVLWAEKQREDALRALGYEVVRFTWADLERAPRQLRRRFLAAFARATYGRG